jgi:DNA-binding beta-propeller fold protein YncE
MNLLNKAALYAGMVVVVFSAVAQADFVTATDNAGRYPRAIAVNPVTNKIYVANEGRQRMSR